MSFLIAQNVQFVFVKFHRTVRTLAMGVFAVLFTLIFTSMIRPEQSPYRFTYNRASSEAPANAKRFLEKNNIKLRTFNNVETGNYMLGNLPWFEPFIDSRFAEVYTAEHFKHYMDILAHPQKFDQFAGRHNFELVLLSYNPPLARGLIQTLAQNENWSLVFVDEVAVIFMRRDVLLSRSDWSRLNRSPVEILRDSLAHLLNYPPRAPWWNYHSDYDVRVKPLTLLAQGALMVGVPDVAENILNLLNQNPVSSPQVASLACSVQYVKVEGLATAKTANSTDLQGEFSKLVELCERSKQKGDRHTSGMILGLFYFNTQNYTASASEFAQILKYDPISYEAQLMLAQSLALTTDWQSSLKHFKEALRLRPQNAEPAYKAAELCQNRSDKNCAIEFLEIAYSRDQNNQTLQWLNSLRSN